MKFCAKCGAQLLDEAMICTKCGCMTEGMKMPAIQAERKKAADGCGITAKKASGILIIFNFLFGIFAMMTAVDSAAILECKICIFRLVAFFLTDLGW